MDISTVRCGRKTGPRASLISELYSRFSSKHRLGVARMIAMAATRRHTCKRDHQNTPHPAWTVTATIHGFVHGEPQRPQFANVSHDLPCCCPDPGRRKLKYPITPEGRNKSCRSNLSPVCLHLHLDFLLERTPKLLLLALASRHEDCIWFCPLRRLSRRRQFGQRQVRKHFCRSTPSEGGQEGGLPWGSQEARTLW
jgi:hypothetical protein